MDERFRAVNGETVVAAMRIFDARFPNSNDYQNWLNDGNYTKAVSFNRRLYPPKYLIELITGIATRDFNTDSDALPLLRENGFTIVDKPS